jgi:methylase of polypeptide subunit release factors
MRRQPLTFLAALIMTGALVVAAAAQAPTTSTAPARTPDVPYVPTPDRVVAEMLKVANVKATDVLYDLGSGDGRIVITAAKKYGARGVGIDIDPDRIREANENAKAAGVADRVKFIQGDIFEMDFSEATVVTMYLLQDVNMKLRPKLMQLRPGTRIVSHNYDLGDWKPERSLNVRANGSQHSVYYWVVKKSAGRR